MVLSFLFLKEKKEQHNSFPERKERTEHMKEQTLPPSRILQERKKKIPKFSQPLLHRGRRPVDGQMWISCENARVSDRRYVDNYVDDVDSRVF